MRFHKTAILRRTRGLRYEIAAAIAVAIIRLSLVTGTCAALLETHWLVIGKSTDKTPSLLVRCIRCGYVPIRLSVCHWTCNQRCTNSMGVKFSNVK